MTKSNFIKYVVDIAIDEKDDNKSGCIIFLYTITLFYSAILILTPLDHWATLGNQRSCRENYFTPGLVSSQHTAPRNIKLAQTPPQHDTSSHIGLVKPRRFISCSQRNSCRSMQDLNHGPLYLQSSTLPLDLRAQIWS